MTFFCSLSRRQLGSELKIRIIAAPVALTVVSFLKSKLPLKDLEYCWLHAVSGICWRGNSTTTLCAGTRQTTTSQLGHEPPPMMEPEAEGEKRPVTSKAGAGEGGGGEKGGQWSNPLPLKEALLQAPVLVQLEDGSRGAVESLSFSRGDVMALEGEIRVKDRRLVLAHFTTEVEGEDGEKVEQAMYRSLLSIPWNHLPEVDVRVCQDSGGVAYGNFVTTHFPKCNWRQQQKELLEDMDERDYDDIREITPTPIRATPAPSQVSKKRRPPPPPPREPLSPSSPSQKSPTTPHRPPPRPPKPPATDDCKKDTRTPDNPGNKPPPRPPPITKLPQSTDATSNPEPLFPSELPEDELDTTIYDYDNSYLELKDDDDDDDGDNSEIYVDMKKQQELLKLKLERELQKQQEKEEKKDSTRKNVKKQGQKTGPQQQDAVVTSASVKPTVRVQPLASVPTSPSERPPMTSPFELSWKGDSKEDEKEYCYELPKDFGMKVSSMTCRQLCARLRLCGMPDLASVCEAQRLDGPFFFSVSTDDLKKPPFSLSDFDINIKLKQVKSGWVPT